MNKLLEYLETLAEKDMTYVIVIVPIILVVVFAVLSVALLLGSRS